MMNSKIYSVVIVILASTLCTSEEISVAETQYSNLLADLWLEGSDVVRIIWRDCSKKLIDVTDVIDHKEYFPKFVRCMKRKTLKALDRSLNTDIVPVTEGVNLVRFEMVDKSGNVLSGDNETSTWSDQELEQGEWRSLALQRIAKVLRTHVIKFDFHSEKQMGDKSEYRGRRRHQMMTMMIFGIVSIGMVVIPMGFQFLAVLGGKALLLAKMALILASIQGLKKIATSPLNYGFYPAYHNYEGYPEKRSYAAQTPNEPKSQTKITHPPNIWEPENKFERRSIANNDVDAVTWHPTTLRNNEKEARHYPVYQNTEQPLPYVTTVSAPITTIGRPGDVQADVTVELPYNGFRFQTPSTVVPA